MSKGKSPSVSGKAPPVALIAGPTASGKSDLAVDLAHALAERGQTGIVVNADSAQVYADLAILSARPTAADMRGIEHRLFGTWDGADACSAAEWADAARQEIARIHAADAVPILVGGTGLYIRTLLDGIAPVPQIGPDVRETVRSLPVEDAYAALVREDPQRAAMLNPADSTRIARALEVVRSSGKSIVHWQTLREGGIAGSIDLHALVLLPDREELYRRCDARFARMLDGGAIDEVKALLARKLDPTLPVMRAIGVPEIAGMLRGEWSREEALTRGAQATRNYAKRQYTWAKHQFPPDWHRITNGNVAEGNLFEILLRN